MEVAGIGGTAGSVPEIDVKREANNFALHVLLIMKDGEKSKTKAQAVAYAEGNAGLRKRLGK